MGCFYFPPPTRAGLEIKKILILNNFYKFSLYSRHLLSRILLGVEKNSRQPEFELKIRPSKPEVIIGSQGMVKNTFQESGKGYALS